MDRILSGKSDRNIPFEQMRSLLEYLGFSERSSGSHHIFTRTDIVELINVQEVEGGKCKPYQVKKVRQVFLDYNIKKEL